MTLRTFAVLLIAISSPLFGDDTAVWVGTYKPSSSWIQAQASQHPGNGQNGQAERLARVSVSLRPNMTFEASLPIGDMAGSVTIDGVDSAGSVGLSLAMAPAARGSPPRVLKASYKDGVLLLKTPFATIPLERADTRQEGTQ